MKMKTATAFITGKDAAVDVALEWLREPRPGSKG